MITLQVIQSWCKEYYPEHYQYRVSVSRSDTHLRTTKQYDSKAELVACVDGLELVFELLKEECKVEFSDAEGETGNYYEYFFPEDHNEHYLEGNSSPDSGREDFHSDG